MGSARAKILHVLGRLNRGGTELRNIELLRHFDRQRYAFEFCCLSGLPGELDQEAQCLGAKVHLIPLGLKFPFHFRRLLRAGRYQTVHSHVHWPSGYILRLAALENIPQRICHFRSTSDGRGGGLSESVRMLFLRRWVRSYATDIVGVSRGALDLTVGSSWASMPNCQVIYNGIDSSRFTVPPDRLGVRLEFGLPANAPIAIHVGRMDPPKNHTRLIAIFHHLCKYQPLIHLLIVGTPKEPILSTLKDSMEKRGISDRVLIAGTRSDVPRLLRASDIMIFPSLWEGLPGAVLEGAAAELPVLSSELPGTAEIAKYLQNVSTLPLTRSDPEWANVANTLLLRKNASGTKFGESPFTIEAAVLQHTLLYSRVGSR